MYIFLCIDLAIEGQSHFLLKMNSAEFAESCRFPMYISAESEKFPQISAFHKVGRMSAKTRLSKW